MQVPQSFANWAAAAPDDLIYAVKGPRFLTHMLKLTRLEGPLANFFASGVLKLGHHLGPILWQFPAVFGFDPDRLIPFFEMLPRTTHQAAKLGARHDHRLRAPAFLDPGPNRPIRHAMEIRHENFRDPRFIELLRRYHIALVCADTVDWPLLMDVTAGFVYCRLHGSTELYKSRYSPAEIDRWASRIRAWSTGATMRDGNFVTPPMADGQPRDVYVFFDNTDKLMAPDNARELMERLGVAASGHSSSIAAE
jgi:uncharacterized protein YecE (DUF72 family)